MLKIQPHLDNHRVIYVGPINEKLNDTQEIRIN